MTLPRERLLDRLVDLVLLEERVISPISLTKMKLRTRE